MRITIIHQPFSLCILRWILNGIISPLETEPRVFFFSSPSQRTFEGPRKKVEEVAVIPMIEI